MKKLSDVLVINSYAGSLHIAAQNRGHPILGSYEDAGYGIPVQRHNYPHVDYRKSREEWEPKIDLSRALTIAHPPCAAFSQQNIVKGKRGVDAAKFQCTKAVLDYALARGTAALAIESVPGALEGAREIHDAAAVKHGYNLFRIVQNSATFGLPQWRPRFWAVYVRKDVRDNLLVEHKPVPATVASILEDEPSFTGPRLLEKFQLQQAKLAAKFGKAETRAILNGKRGYGNLAAILCKKAKAAGETVDRFELSAELCVFGKFQSNILRVLDERTLAPTVLGTAFFTVRGRVCSDREYSRIMGFPDEYVFPESALKHHKFYLARGVCPPVAEWILDTMERNVTAPKSYYGRGTAYKPGVLECEPGGTVSVMPPSRAAWDRVVAGEVEALA